MAKHALRPSLHTLPGAAALLATPAVARSSNGRLQALQHWAPAPLLQVRLTRFVMHIHSSNFLQAAACAEGVKGELRTPGGIS